MKTSNTKFSEVLIIEPNLFEDNRGWFFESYTREKYLDLGISTEFTQDNHSLSIDKHTIRGMHFQLNPKAQTKLIRVSSGSIINFVVDIRTGSPTYGQYDSIALDSINKKHLYLPIGFANGFITLTENTEIIYKVDNYYSPEHDRSFRWNDPDININWPTDNPILSERDIKAPMLKDVDNNFVIVIA